MPGIIYPTWFSTQAFRSHLEFLALDENEARSMVQVLAVGDVAATPYDMLDMITAKLWESIIQVFPNWIGQRAGLDELWFIFSGAPRVTAQALASLLCDDHDCTVHAAVFVAPSGAKPRLCLLDMIGAALRDGIAIARAAEAWRIHAGHVSPMDAPPPSE